MGRGEQGAEDVGGRLLGEDVVAQDEVAGQALDHRQRVCQQVADDRLADPAEDRAEDQEHRLGDVGGAGSSSPPNARSRATRRATIGSASASGRTVRRSRSRARRGSRAAG